jgi:short-subunit dehydrogenase
MKRAFLITGASKCIGLALANRLSGQGHEVIGVARNAIDTFPGLSARSWRS